MNIFLKMILETYNKCNETKKINSWNYDHFIDFEKDDIDHDIDDENNMNLSLIKNIHSGGGSGSHVRVRGDGAVDGADHDGCDSGDAMTIW